MPIWYEIQGESGRFVRNMKRCRHVCMGSPLKLPRRLHTSITRVRTNCTTSISSFFQRHDRTFCLIRKLPLLQLLHIIYSIATRWQHEPPTKIESKLTHVCTHKKEHGSNLDVKYEPLEKVIFGWHHVPQTREERASIETISLLPSCRGGFEGLGLVHSYLRLLAKWPLIECRALTKMGGAPLSCSRYNEFPND